MTEEAQRIAIAEACGWVSEADRYYEDKLAWRHPDRYCRWATGDLPDYLNDLNAIQSAIMSQGWGDSEEVDFIFALVNVCDPHKQDPFASTCATAAQRAEAFLRMKGLWVE